MKKQLKKSFGWRKNRNVVDESERKQGNAHRVHHVMAHLEVHEKVKLVQWKYKISNVYIKVRKKREREREKKVLTNIVY